MDKKIIFGISIISAALIGGYIATYPGRSVDKPDQTTLQQQASESNLDTVVLDLSGKGLTELGPSVTNRNDVRVLNLSNNQLTSLPPEIGNMTNLEEINVENNRLVTLPPEIGKLTKLKRADFSNNRLTSLPRELGNLTGLQFLNLSGYDASKSDAQDIKARLSNTEVKF